MRLNGRCPRLGRVALYTLALLGGGVLFADPAPPAAPLPATDESEPARTEKEYIVGKDTDLAALGITGPGAADVAHVVTTYLKGKPVDTKLRLVLGEGFSNHPARYGMALFVKSVVPLNAAGKPDGTECFLNMYGGDPSRYVPWKDGLREGVERVMNDGALKAEIPWHQDQIEGLRKTYFPNGKVQTETVYAAGTANGATKTYTEGGALLREGTMKGGKREGLLTDYWAPDPLPKRVVTYHEGKVEGVVKEYYRSGKLKREVAFTNDVMHGVETNYLESGAVDTVKYWRNGDAISKEDYEKAAPAAK